MRVIFCNDPLQRGRVDAAYEAEWSAAAALDLPVELISYEALVDEADAERAVRRVAPAPAEAAELGVYRGWMLRPEAYTRLYDTLAVRNVHLINPPDAYRRCHYLPESYPAIADHTPATVWLQAPPGEGGVMSAVHDALRPFGDKPVIVKDYV